MCPTCRQPASDLYEYTFHQHIGLIIMMYHRQVPGVGCGSCKNMAFLTAEGITLLAGWWGVISVFVTPLTLCWNVVVYLTARRLGA